MSILFPATSGRGQHVTFSIVPVRAVSGSDQERKFVARVVKVYELLQAALNSRCERTPFWK